MSVWKEGSWGFPIIHSLPLVTTSNLSNHEQQAERSENRDDETTTNDNDSTFQMTKISELNSKYSFGNFLLKRSLNNEFQYPRVMFYPPSSETLWYSDRCTYFEIILHEPHRDQRDIAAQRHPSLNNSSSMTIGIGFSKCQKFFGVLGWTPDTIGFHFDNGRVYDDKQITSSIKDQVYICDVHYGQVYGCLLDHEIGEFHVTRNGVLLKNAIGNRFIRKSFCERGNAFLPTVSCFDTDVELEINLGCDLVKRPFRYFPLVRYEQGEKLFSTLQRVNNDNGNHEHTSRMKHSDMYSSSDLFFTDTSIKTLREEL